MTDKTIAVPDWHTDPYLRIVNFFDMDATAGSFLAEDGEGGFAGAIHRMAREIDRMRSAQPPQEHLVGCEDLRSAAKHLLGVLRANRRWINNSLAKDETIAIENAVEAVRAALATTEGQS